MSVPTTVELLKSWGLAEGRDITHLLVGAAGSTITVNLSDYLTTLETSCDVGTGWIEDYVQMMDNGDEDYEDFDFVHRFHLLEKIVMMKLMNEERLVLLLSIALEEGGFESPIGCAITGTGIEQENGHHRLVAAIMAGRPTIEVYVQPDAHYIEWDSTGGHDGWESYREDNPQAVDIFRTWLDEYDWNFALNRARL